MYSLRLLEFVCLFSKLKVTLKFFNWILLKYILKNKKKSHYHLHGHFLENCLQNVEYFDI